jgi:fused signal recognition particle receptor
MSENGKKPGLLRRLFGLGAPEPVAKEPAKKEPPSRGPARKAPEEPPAQKEPPRQRPAKKEPPDPGSEKGSAAKPKRRAAIPKGPPPAGPHTEPSVAAPDKEASRSGPKPKGPPPAGPHTEPGQKSPEESPPERRKKETLVAHESSKRGWFGQLRQGLARSSTALADNLASVLTKRRLDADALDALEEVLIKADLGPALAARMRETLAASRHPQGMSPEAVREVLAAEIAKVLEPLAKPLALDASAHPHVILVLGVNGTGKTTTAAKLAHRFMASGQSVLLAAADTFRAAAIDQLKIWGNRVGAEVVAKDVGADPAGVAFEALERARAERRDVLLIDTAGRLQNKADLMAELAKIVRVLKKLDPSAPHSVVLVLDATTGQNALAQVQIFQEIAGVTSLVMAKLDGSARGGILVAIAERFGLPINAIGIGEGLDDLEPFDAQDFARAIAGLKTEHEAAA